MENMIRLRQEIIEFLAPFALFDTVDTRKALLLSGGLDHVIRTLALSGNKQEFVTLLVDHLAQSGADGAEEPAVIVLLDAVAQHVGIDKKALIADFCARLRQQQSAVAAFRARCPYRGLEIFRAEDAHLFFGRSQEIAAICQQVEQAALTAVIGASGSGKSSLVCAGVLPALQAETPALTIVGFRPGEEPLHALAAALIVELEPDLTEIPRLVEQNALQAALLAHTLNLPEVFRRIIVKRQAAGLLLVIDQFEELYTAGPLNVEREQFIAHLLAAQQYAAAHAQALYRMILTLRSDFLGQTNSHPELSQAIAAQHFLVPAMRPAQLREAIARPAADAGEPLDEATIDRLLEQSAGREGALPLLQFALQQIWEGCGAGVAAADTLTRLKGVGGALAHKAQTLYDALPEPEQQIARRAFLGMIRLGEGAHDTRRRVALTSLVAYREKEEVVHRVVQQFAKPDARLLALGDNAAEITHEALLEHWALLAQWVHESRDDLRFKDRLEAAAQHWHAGGRKSGTLWQSPDLEALIAFRQRAGQEMTALQMDYCRAALRRKRLAALTTAAVMLVLAGLTALSAIGFFRATRAEQRAVQQKELALKAINSLTYELVDELNKLPRTAPILTKILESNTAILDQIYALDPATLDAQREKASNLLKTGNTWLVLGDTENVLKAYQQSFEILKQLADADPTNTQAQHDLSVSYIKLGDLQMQLGDTSAALTLYQQDLEITKRLADADPTNTPAQRDLSISYNKLGDLQVQLGDTQAALTLYQQSFEILKQLADADPTNTQAQHDLSVSYIKLGDLQMQLGDTPTALTLYQQSSDILKQLAEADPTNTQAQRDLSVSYEKLGNVQTQLGDTPTALTLYQQALDISKRLADADPTNVEAQRDLSVSYNKLGDLQRQLNDTSAALTLYQQSLDIRKRLADADPANTEAQRDLSVSYNKLGDLQVQLGDASAALTLYQQSLEIAKLLADADPTNTQAQRDLMVSYTRSGVIAIQQNDTVQARTYWQQALTIAERLAQDKANARAQSDLQWVQNALKKLGPQP